MAFDATKPNTSQQIGDVITSTRDNDAALKAQIDAHQADSTAHGLPSLVATQADYVAHKADSTTAHGLATTNAGVLALQTEMAALQLSLQESTALLKSSEEALQAARDERDRLIVRLSLWRGVAATLGGIAAILGLILIVF